MTGPGRPGGGTLPRPVRVLFVCTGNSARSQMAEALLRRDGGADFEVASAGTEPRGVHPLTVRALAGVGIDWSGARSTSVAEYLDRRFDWVVTVCERARERCPVFPGAHRSLHWDVDDPAEAQGDEAQRAAAFDRVRRKIAARVRAFVPLARDAAGRAGADVDAAGGGPPERA